MRYGGTASVRTWIEHYDGLRVVYGYEILNESGDICVTATTKNVCVNKDTWIYPQLHPAYEEAKN